VLQKAGWVGVVALTLLVEAILISLAYETGFVDVLKRMVSS